MVTASKLPVNGNASAMDMAETIFGDGVTVVSASYTGDARSSGIYSNGDSIAPGVTPSDSGVILSTGRASDFTNSASNGPPWAWWLNNDANQNDNTSTNTSGVNNDPAFNAVVGAPTFDAAFIDADFIPTGDVMSMQFVFASEEYPEFTTSQFQDSVGVWVNGSFVPISVGSGDTAPNNINDESNANLFVDNTESDFNSEMDGFTLTMSLTIPVNPGEVNSIRIGIADVNDANYDSNLLIAADSVQTTLVAMDDTTKLFPDGTKTLDLLGNDINNTAGTLTITHLNGQSVAAGDTVTLNSGQQLQLNADGTIDVIGDGDTEEFNFTYEVESSTGETDVGFVNVDSVPCFVAGTLIRTPSGEVAVETLQPGDLVVTQDEGAQPLRWIGRRQVAAQGAFAPIHIDAGTFGRHRDLLLSPLHRVLIRDSLAELLFGEGEVLIAARDLVNDRSVCRVEGGTVDYVHILFDRHQVVFSEGLATESFLPGPQTARSFEAEIVAEICALFPEIDPETGTGYSPAARRMLRRYEARLLLAHGEAA
ncbi:Hint domain-containing protein [uncultured Roseovarius sp.]|uniref:Hint domain-containing protein n=1 Tax=uncultured Roseovarius sp. TaxID=293344 RepID=UPI00262727DB|nr:Hint domain-containing protein [uncultured Roseovarius sp.]